MTLQPRGFPLCLSDWYSRTCRYRYRPECERLTVRILTVAVVPATTLRANTVTEVVAVIRYNVHLRNASHHVVAAIARIRHLDRRPARAGLRLIMQVVIAISPIDRGLLEIHVDGGVILHRNGNGSGRAGRGLCRNGGCAGLQTLNRGCGIGPAVTLATLVSPLYHVTVPELGVGVAVNVMVLLSSTSCVSLLIVNEPVVVLPPPALEPEGAPVTVIFAVAHRLLSATEHAVIVADPFFKPSTVPLFTDATVGSELVIHGLRYAIRAIIRVSDDCSQINRDIVGQRNTGRRSGSASY